MSTNKLSPLVIATLFHHASFCEGFVASPRELPSWQREYTNPLEEFIDELSDHRDKGDIIESSVNLRYFVRLFMAHRMEVLTHYFGGFLPEQIIDRSDGDVDSCPIEGIMSDGEPEFLGLALGDCILKYQPASGLPVFKEYSICNDDRQVLFDDPILSICSEMLFKLEVKFSEDHMPAAAMWIRDESLGSIISPYLPKEDLSVLLINTNASDLNVDDHRVIFAFVNGVKRPIFRKSFVFCARTVDISDIMDADRSTNLPVTGELHLKDFAVEFWNEGLDIHGSDIQVWTRSGWQDHDLNTRVPKEWDEYVCVMFKN